MNKAEFTRKLGKRIIYLREQKGWTQADLSRATFKDAQNIERIENGKTNPTGYVLYQIAEALDIPVKELLDF